MTTRYLWSGYSEQTGSVNAERPYRRGVQVEAERVLLRREESHPVLAKGIQGTLVAAAAAHMKNLASSLSLPGKEGKGERRGRVMRKLGAVRCPFTINYHLLGKLCEIFLTPYA